jgi:hypothetical protein
VDTNEPEAEGVGPLVCLRCGAPLRPGSGELYRITVEAVADPYPPDFTADDLAGDPRRKIERLLAQMEGLSEQEALDQVFRRRTFHLCVPCYRRWMEAPTG